VPGRDFSGEVVDVFDESAKDWVGKEVWGTGGARGFAFDGTYAECVSPGFRQRPFLGTLTRRSQVHKSQGGGAEQEA